MNKIKWGFLLIVFIFFACNTSDYDDYLQRNSKTKIPTVEYEIEIIGEFGAFNIEDEVEEIEPGLKIHTFTLKSEYKLVPPHFSAKWDVPVVDICGQWSTGAHLNKLLYPNWSSRGRVKSRATNNAPVYSLYNNIGQNRITFACSDALNTIELRAGLKEEDANFSCEVHFFTEKHVAVNEYQVQLWIDTRKIHFSESLSEVSEWWASMDEYKPLSVPDVAKLPMYSSWYSFHQNLVVEEVLEQCRMAKKMGYEAIIIDDGWQTLDSNRGYSYTGDWKPERIPEMRAFVDSIHDIGMKFILWYSVPYIGDKSKNYRRFMGKYLDYWGGEWGGSYTLDPRYPDVREFLIETYENAVTKWGLDGFKLDFVDDFIAREDTRLTATNGRDYASVNEAVDRLMTDIMIRLKELKPDILIEFRQSYIGPLMRKYGNMFRASDCPDSYIYNRIRTTDVRLLSGTTPAHADMLMWHKNEPVEVAALHMLNILHSVPQLSVRIDQIPDDHIEMIKFWTSYWKRNRDVLLDGEFKPFQPNASYPLIRTERDRKIIYEVFEDLIVPVNGNFDQLDLINGKKTSSIVIKLNEKKRSALINIYTCKGEKIITETRNLQKGLNEIQVPPSGLITIQ